MNFEVTFVSTQKWDFGGTGKITIKNLGSTVSSWNFMLKTLNFTITDMWQLTVSTSNGVVTISPAAWNLTSPFTTGTSISSGFTYSGSSDLQASSLTTGVRVVSDTTTPVPNPTPVPVLSLEVTLTSTASWVTGGNALMKIKNLGSELNTWSFQLTTSNFVITDLWAAKKVGTGSNITVSAPDWKQTLGTGETYETGFSYTGNSVFSATTSTSGVKLVLPGSTPVVPVPTPVDPTPVPVDPVPTPVPTGKKVYGYFTEWSIYDRQFSVSQIPVNKLTHILYAFMLPNPSQADFDLLQKSYQFPVKPYYPSIPEGTLVAHDEYANGINIAGLRKLKIDHPHIKVIISVLGWTLSWTMSKIVADPVLRKRFITSSVNFVVTNGFDGLDVDWEYPSRQGAGYNYVDEVNDSKNYAIFVKELRAEFTRVSTGKYYEISAAMGTNPVVIESHREVIPYLDTVLMMTYDYAGAWDNFGGHLSALYHNPESQTDPAFNVDSAVTKTLSMGVPANKLCLGIMMDGRGWTKIVPKNPAQPLFGISTSGGAVSLSGRAGEPGLSLWKDIRNNVNKNGFIRYYDSIAKATYIHNATTGETWTYEDPMSVREKVKYALSKGLGGLMFWENSSDSRDGVDSILDAAVNQLTVTTV